MDLELLGLITQIKNGTYTKEEINQIVETLNTFTTHKVESLPTENIDTKAIYFVPRVPGTDNLYDEYIYIDDNWELIGTTEVDLSEYPTVTEMSTAISTALSDYSTTSEINTMLSDYSTTSEINTMLSDYSTTTQVSTAISTALSGYSTTTQVSTAINTALALGDYATVSYVNTAINSAIGTAINSVLGGSY